MTARIILCALLLSLPLHADGVETAIGVSFGPTSRGASSSHGDTTTGLQVRVGWDESWSHIQMDQWQALAQTGSNHDLTYATAGAGWQHSWWTESHRAQAALGAELRVEHYQGRDTLASGTSPLNAEQAWMVRPWLRAQAGFRGILFPFLPGEAFNFLAWLTEGGTYTHPFTRLEVAVPLSHRGGEDPRGTLLQMAPRWEASVQFGMRFGCHTPR